MARERGSLWHQPQWAPGVYIDKLAPAPPGADWAPLPAVLRVWIRFKVRLSFLVPTGRRCRPCCGCGLGFRLGLWFVGVDWAPLPAVLRVRLRDGLHGIPNGCEAS